MIRPTGILPTCVVVLGLVGCQWQLQPSCSVEHTGPVVVDTPRPGGPAVKADAEPAMCPGPARTGDSPCFFHDCSAGMYCDDLDMPDCRPGCASDQDCGPRDTCVRSGGGPVGRCEPCAQHTAHAAAPGCVVASRTGRTRCTGSECGPGQYCDDAANWSCVPGCASDENCGPSEFCERPTGTSVGVCRSCFF